LRAPTYGFDRAEDIAGIGVSLAIWGSAVFAGFVSVHKLTEHGRTSHFTLGIAAAAIGILGNQVVARYKGRTGKRIHSMTLMADAKHSWLDAISSAGALVGLAATAAGVRGADGVAGLFITAFIIHVGWEVTTEVLGHLMDGVDPELVRHAEAAALEVEGIEHVHVRARWSGRSLLFDIEGFIPATSTLDYAEGLGREVERAVATAVPESRAVFWSPHVLPN
jgi:cation diffusion facilitator family transporter